MGAIKKKIILTVTNDLNYDQRMQRICRSLSRGGYEVELVGRKRPHSSELKKEPYKQTRLKCFFTKGKLFYIEYNWRLFFYLLFSRFSALCAIDLDTIAAVYFAGKWKKSRLVYDAHEYFTETPEVVQRKNIQKIWLWVERTFVPRFDLAYTVSDGIAQLFEKKYNIKFGVIRNLPVYAALTQSKPQQTADKYLLYQGALNEGRGLESLIDAMNYLDVHLMIAGEGDLSDKLRTRVKQQHLENKVTFCGFKQPNELRQLTSLAHIGINLLENKGASYYHSLANKFFDYIHAGVPQVCIGFPEYEKINAEYEIALLIKNASVDEIKNAVQRLLNDNSFYSQLQRNCSRCAQELNWQQEEKKLLTLYDELLR